ncbi:sensor histidine kinase [Streptacidiphilus jiangxiensis]|uniref:histidine kinase n=1 Tax=Streptacidiphilus jiangxiensis TaxID=235985 RepID=A0A1H7WAT1_STRJI|nr:histidine kinase [Streptacidiphilus jiangxiensis]SEM18613.1 Signal transduction histidine kinase [Streptacidiphilus jiangxiensis]
MRETLAQLGADRRARDAAPALVLALVFAVTPVFGAHGSDTDTWATLLAVISCLPLLVRSRWPLAVVTATVALDVLRIVLTPHAEIIPAASLVALYTLASLRRRALAWPVGIAAAVVITAVYALAHGQSGTSGVVLGLFDLPLLATALGDIVRNRRAHLAEAEARAERAERTREEEARRAVTEERLRIARELHDITAHHLTLVNAQAGVAHLLMRTNPEAAYQALGQIKETSLAALDEMRATVGLLRSAEDVPEPVNPLPTLADLDDLLASFRATGTRLDVERRGNPEPVPASAQLAAYRIVQEALTNARKHAPGAAVHVLVEYHRDELHLAVVNDPHRAAGHRHRSKPDEPSGGAGHGLIGMRERAGALGGSVEAGPDAAGRYRVRARLPLNLTHPVTPNRSAELTAVNDSDPSDHTTERDS